MLIARRTGLGAAMALAAATVMPSLAESADGCSMLQGKTVTLVVPYPTGGGFDQYARLLDPHLEKAIGAEIVVSNVDGAGGLIGAKQVRDAAPDGRTIGLLSANDAIMQRVFGEKDAPLPTRDYTLLGQIDEEPQLWLVKSDSPIVGIETLWQRTEPMVAGVSGGDAYLLAIALGAEMAGIKAEYVSGYRGTRDMTLALMRGEVDVIPIGYGSSLELVRSGEARPILHLRDERLAPDLAMQDVPILGGPDGIAAKRAAATGRSVEEAQAMVSSALQIMPQRRVVAAPVGLDGEVADCLKRGFLEAATSPGYTNEIQRTGRGLNVLNATETTERLRRAEEGVTTLSPMAQAAAKRLRS